MIVRNVMTKDIVTVGPKTSLKTLATLFRRSDISGVPVVEDDRVVGIVSETDLVRKEEAPLEERSGVRRLLRRPAPDEKLLTAGNVSGVMTSPVVVVESWMSVAAAAYRMVEHKVNRLPVVENEKLVGIVTRADLVSAFARTDGAILGELRTEVLPSLGLSPNDVSITVDRGWVTLSGEVDDARDARSLEHATRCVIGVVDVISDLGVRVPV